MTTTIITFTVAGDIEQLKRFACGGYCDDSTIVYLQHPCVILSALEASVKKLLIKLLSSNMHKNPNKMFTGPGLQSGSFQFNSSQTGL